MIIEQVESLKSWLTNQLSPICDAEPIALAKYVCALLKKNKPEQDLRDICVDQLDVFLQQKTKTFVDDLFKALQSKVYISSDGDKSKPAPLTVRKVENVADKEKADVQKKKSEITSTTDDKTSKDSGSAATSQVSTGPQTSTTTSGVKDSKDSGKDSREVRDNRDRENRTSPRDRRDSWRDERSRNEDRKKDSGKADEKGDSVRDARDIIRERGENRDKGIDTREVREPGYRDRDAYRRRRSRSRSYSPRRRDYDDRRRRFEDRGRYSPDRRWGRRRSWSRSPRRRSPLDRGPRARSRSPRLRSRSPRYRSFRSRSRSRSPRRARSWSRPTSPGGIRSHSPVRQPDSRGSTPTQDNDYSTLISSSTNDLPAVTSTVGLRPVPGEEVKRQVIPPGNKSRCQNFEEKGYCVLGDMCPYDHGSDPVVVEDMTLPTGMPAASVSGAPPGTGFIPPDIRVPPPGHPVEPYLPEAPGLQAAQRPHFLRGPPPPGLPPPGMIITRPPGPDPFFRREVVMNRPPHLEEDLLDTLAAEKAEPSRIVIPTKRPYSAISSGPDPMSLVPPPPRMAHLNQHHHMFGVPPHPGPIPMQQPMMAPGGDGHPFKRGFDFSRLGRGGKSHHGPRPFKTGNLTIEVRKIPSENNNIAKLNEHFGKFGTLTNIQVKYQGDPGGALISFSNNGEATAAYRSPEPVFNNRFIKLFWHNPERAAEADMEKEVGEGEKLDIVTSGVRTGGRVGDGIDHPSLVLPKKPSIPPAHKLTLDNTKAKNELKTINTATENTSATSEKSIVYTSSVGNLKKTVFNSSAGPTPTTPTTPTSPTSPKVQGLAAASKPSDIIARIEKMKRLEAEKKVAAVKQAELDLKRQELMAKQIQQQKILLDALEKKKATMSETERKSLLQTLRAISDAIDKTKYGTGSKKLSQPPSSGASSFKFVSQEQVQKAQKEQLDQELDMMTKQKTGDEFIANRPVVFGRGRGAWARGGWRGRGRGGAIPGAGRMVLDNRPKTVEVKSFDLSELEEIKTHFMKFGEFAKVDIEEEIPSAFFTFTTRQAAEMAVAAGSKFKQKTLIVRWNQPPIKMHRDSAQNSDVDDDLTITLGSLDDEALLGMSGDEKSRTATTSATASHVSTPTHGTDLDTGLEPQESDSRSVIKEEPQSKKIALEHSLSEELLGDEHFKASYSDDEDDNITVTVNLNPSPPTIKDEEALQIGNDDDLANMDNAVLDYTEDGDSHSWT